MYIELLKLKEIYGDVFCVYVGLYKLIIISGYDNIYYVFVKYGLNFSYCLNWLFNVKLWVEIYGYGKYILIGGWGGCRVLEISFSNYLVLFYFIVKLC